jgi:hypothetical protein
VLPPHWGQLVDRVLIEDRAEHPLCLGKRADAELLLEYSATPLVIQQREVAIALHIVGGHEYAMRPLPSGLTLQDSLGMFDRRPRHALGQAIIGQIQLQLNDPLGVHVAQCAGPLGVRFVGKELATDQGQCICPTLDSRSLSILGSCHGHQLVERQQVQVDIVERHSVGVRLSR